MQGETELRTANFFFPSDPPPVTKCRLTANRKLVAKHDKQPIQLGISIPSTTDTKIKTNSKPNSAQSNIQEQSTPPQIGPDRKRFQIHTKTDERKPNNYRILSSNINQRSSYPQDQQLGNQLFTFGNKYDNEFLQMDSCEPQMQQKQVQAGVISPSKQLKKLPDIFHRQQKNSSQGFRIHSSISRRGTMSNFEEKKELEKKNQDLQSIKSGIPKFRDTQVKLPGLQQQQQGAVHFLQAKQQMKIINRIFSGKRDF